MSRITRALRALFIVPSLLAVVHAGPVSLTRYALVIGSNAGGADRIELKYAVSDARSFAGILTEMGGVSKERCIVSANPDRKTLLGEFGRLQKIVDNEKTLPGRKEAVVYYSGHADEAGIILGKEQYTYKEMRQSLQTIGVDVRIAVLDACASGSLTREKGGMHRQPFLYDVSTSMEGHAYLTSSSSDEASQESDAIKSSFFTHYLISGMRGPADGNSDGKVTLNEAYEFAYDETLQRTEKTRAGPQHAAYDIRLKGSGDLVLTDLRTSSSLLRLMPPVHGRIYIHDAGGHLLVELYKNEGKKLEIGLEPGVFEVVISDTAETAAATVTLTDGHTVELTGTELHKVKRLHHRVRGSSTEPSDTTPYVHIPVNVSLLPAFSLNGMYGKTLTNFSISLIAGRTDRLLGLELSSGISAVSEETVGGQIAAAVCMAGEVTGLQIAGGANFATGNCRGVQLAGAFNSAGKSMRGLQIGGGVNLAGGRTTGVQIAGAMNQAQGDARILQIAGAYNYVHGNARGIQIAGAVNVTSLPCTGLLIAGGVNFTESTCGLQIAGGVNLSREMRGFQIATINLCREMRGFQIAAVNICRTMRGFQIGVINICDTMSGMPIGVFNYVKSVPPRYRVSVDEAGFTHVTVRSGTEQMYSLLSLGTSTALNRYQWTSGLGIGGRVKTGNGYVALESIVYNIHEKKFWDEQSMMHIQNAFIYSHRITKHYSLWGGPTFNMGITWNKGKERVSYMDIGYKKFDRHWFAVWPGFMGGIEL